MTKQAPSDPLTEFVSEATPRPSIDELLGQATPQMGRPPQALTDIARAVTVDPLWEMGQGVGSLARGEVGDEVGKGLTALLGTISPAMFLGAGARTANLEALRLAQYMERRGASREKIRDQTDWFKGADGKWAFEVSDEGLRVPKMPDGTPMGVIEGGGLRYLDTIEHPLMAAAYPEQTANLAYRIRDDVLGPHRGAYYAPTEKEPWHGIAGTASGTQDARSVMAHELSHFVDEIEDFARGANPEYYKKLIPQEIAAAVPEKNLNEAAFEAYRRNASEVRARLVQARLNMTDAERRAVHPWQMEDVPAAQQTVMGIRLKPVSYDPFAAPATGVVPK